MMVSDILKLQVGAITRDVTTYDYVSYLQHNELIDYNVDNHFL
jgi:hypothetical protein